MHQCLKCGRTVQTVTEIEEGCPCGSKVFVFTRHPSAASASTTSLPGAKSSSKSKITLMPFASKSVSPTPEDPIAESEKPAPLAPAQDSPARSAAAVVTPPAPAISAPLSVKAQKASNPPATPVLTPASAPISDDEETEVMDEPYSEVWLAKGGRVQSVGPAEPGVENVRQLTRGVYEVDVRSLSDGPMVVRDADGIYYVRLPFAPLPGPDGDTNPK